MVVLCNYMEGLVIRPIAPEDKAELQRGLGRLSRETVYRRFLSAKPRFTSAELRYLTEVDGINHIAFVAVDSEERIVAVARCIRLLEAPDTAEWAIVVADHLQGRGLGSELIDRLADAARAVGIRRFTATMLEDNIAVQRLLDRTTERLERIEHHGATREVTALLTAA